MKRENEVVAYYDTIAENYDESRFNNSYGQFIDTQERWVLDKLLGQLTDEMRLDMACGTGRLTNYATHGLDASSEMMKRAQERYPNVRFCKASATETGYKNETFDVVYTFHLLMHLDTETISEIIDEVYRILKPGGRFILDIPSKKRRQLLRHKQASWHGGTELTSNDVVRMTEGKFRLNSSHGIMMLPIHKLPNGIRNSLLKTDFALANGWLKEYSSYLILELKK